MCGLEDEATPIQISQVLHNGQTQATAGNRLVQPHTTRAHRGKICSVNSRSNILDMNLQLMRRRAGQGLGANRHA